MSNYINTVPVLPSQNIRRDVDWYCESLGFSYIFGDDMYAGLKKDNLEIHLQWHADTDDDPLLGGSVIKFFVQDIMVVYDELIQRKTIKPEKLRENTPWGTHEIGIYDLNKNAIFFVQDI